MDEFIKKKNFENLIRGRKMRRTKWKIRLLSLFFFFMTTSVNKKTKTKKEVATQVEETPICESSASESEKAAIAMALHLYFAEVHDTESYCLTIRQNPNSAWNSKIYGMNNLNK